MKKLVEKSIRQYLAIQEKLTEMAELVQDGKISALEGPQHQWQLMHAEARETDRQLDLLRKSDNPSEAFPSEMQHRQQIMLQIKQQCEKLMRRVRDLQVLTEDELMRLRKGRRALGGYRSSNRGAGHSNLGSC